MEDELRNSRDKLQESIKVRITQLERRADQPARLTSELILAGQRERPRFPDILHDDLQQLLVEAGG